MNAVLWNVPDLPKYLVCHHIRKESSHLTNLMLRLSLFISQDKSKCSDLNTVVLEHKFEGRFKRDCK